MTDNINIYALNEFTAAYIEAALWSSTDNSDESGGNPLDDNYDICDIAPETLAKMVQDCRDFREANARAMRLTGADDDQHGHDFWLTRNHHGTGFWDRDYRFGLGERLTEAAHVYGTVDLYIGDDGQVHG